MMKIDSKHLIIIVGVVIVIALLVSILNKKSSGGASGGWTVYGSNHCGWTTKQRKMMDDKGIKYKYVDCEVENCPGISGFPTLKNDDGTVKVGYTPM